MYSQDKINIALQVYHQCESVTVTINVLKQTPASTWRP